MIRKGYIYRPDAREYNLPLDKVAFESTGYWLAEGGRHITSWAFADGSHPEMQFSKNVHNVFFLESIN